jgi:hypothetical protein
VGSQAESPRFPSTHAPVTPAVAVITEAFVQTAELMAEVCGAPGYRFAVIGHPFASDHDQVVRQKAHRAVEQIVQLLTKR